MSFSTALRSTLAHEGYYANVAGDKGGETYRGIARNYHPDWKGWPIIDLYKIRIGRPLDRNEKVPGPQLEKLVEAFYYEKFWRRSWADRLRDGSLAHMLFDFFVHSGGNAVKELQRVLNAHFGASLKVDGAMGPQTAQTANAQDPERLFARYKEARIAYYRRISQSGENWKFLKGWLRRAEGFKYLSIPLATLAVLAGLVYFFF